MTGFGYFSKVFKTWSFKGRARRREFWYFVLFYALISWVIGFIAPKLLGKAEITFMQDMYLNPQAFWQGLCEYYTHPSSLVSLVVSLIFLIPSICVTVRRLHDTGRSGWWYWIVFVPIIGPIVLLVFMLMDSQFDTNKYGPNPKAYDQEV